MSTNSKRGDEAVIASLRPFITKLASALTAVLTSATYLLFDVTSYTNQISSLEQQCTQGLITESEKLDLISGRALQHDLAAEHRTFAVHVPAALRDDASVLLPL